MSKAIDKFHDDILNAHIHAVRWAKILKGDIQALNPRHDMDFINDLVSESELLLLEAKNINKAVLELLANYKKEKDDE